MRPALLVALLLGAQALRAQAPLAWERVGDIPVNAQDLVVAPDGALWAGSFRLWRLDTSVGAAGVWVEVADRNVERFRFLSPDTLLRNRGVFRSLDGGQSWALMYGDGRDFLYEVLHGRPYARTLLTGTNGGLARSTDRGATWTQAAFQTGTTSNSMLSAVSLTNGRVVATGNDGLLYSDDGGATFHPGSVWQYLRYLGYALGTVTAPGGGERALAVVADAARPHLVVYGSGDGASWTELAELEDVDDGGVGQGGIAGPTVHALGGPSTVVVLGRGSVYRTDDAGATWTLMGRVPIDTTLVRAGSSVIGSDGRLYVGLRTGLAELGWVWRTAEPVVVASEGGPAPERGLSLSVAPNPARGAASLVLTLARPGAARVVLYDLLGRAVAVVHEGPLGAGPHRLALAEAPAPGVYVVRATAGGEAVTARLVVLR